MSESGCPGFKDEQDVFFLFSTGLTPIPDKNLFGANPIYGLISNILCIGRSAAMRISSGKVISGVR